MTKKICAVTVSQNYIERSKYSIKYLMVGQRKCGQPFWYVRHVGETGFGRVVLEDKAIAYGHKHAMPYLLDIRHGDNVSLFDKAILKKYGVAVK